MKREELHNDLRRPFEPGARCGVARIDVHPYQNVWFVVPPPPPVMTPKNAPLNALKRANGVINQMPRDARVSDLDQIVSYLFVRKEALNSSRMEGTWSTIDHVLTPPDLVDDPSKDGATASIRGYADALEQNFALVQKKSYPAFTVPFVQKLHKIITAKDPAFRGRPGKLRAPGHPGAVVQIGGVGRPEESTYNPAPPEEVARCLEETMAWYRDDLLAEKGDAGIGGMPLLVRLAIGHAHFEAVHPFSDGNGRVGRMLWPFQMLLAGMTPLYLSGYIEVEKRAYGEALQAAQKRLDYAPLIEFLAEAFVASHEEAKRTKEVLRALPDAWKTKGKFRSDSAAIRALPTLIKSPIVTANELAYTLGISFPAASNALKALTEKGVLRERTGYKKNRVFAAEEILAVLGRTFGEDPALALDSAARVLGHSTR